MTREIRPLPWLLGCALGALAALAHADEAAAPFTVEDLVVLKRVADPQVSPDGRLLAAGSTDGTVRILS